MKLDKFEQLVEDDIAEYKTASKKADKKSNH